MSANARSSSSFKRGRTSPTGLTPTQKAKRALTRNVVGKKLDFNVATVGQANTASASRSSISKGVRKKVDSWSGAEEASLVDYVLSKGYTKSWPTTKAEHFWEDAKSFIHAKGYATQRTSGSCRARVFLKLSQQYASPDVAKESISSENLPPAPPRPPVVQRSIYSPISIQHCTPSTSLSSIDISTKDPIMEHLSKLSCDDQLSLLSEAFSRLASKEHDLQVPGDFMPLALSGMQRLKNAGRSDVIYGICKCIGSSRPDGSDSWIPTNRMPMGLIEYIVNFYRSKDGSKVLCPNDYCQWLCSMFILFGTKWSKLYCGPLWSFEATEQGACSTKGGRDPLSARVNVPAPVARTLQRYIASGDFTLTADVQEKVLDEAHRLLPNAYWWIKADGVDLLSGLEESVDFKWNGDVDLGDGELQLLYAEYRSRIDDIPKRECAESKSCGRIQHLLSCVERDLVLINEYLTKASSEYSSKVGMADNKTMLDLAWKVDELSRLNTTGRSIVVELQCLLEMLKDDQDANVGSTVDKIGESLTAFLKGFYKHRRTPATHALAVLISPEDRKRKPYAVPIQLIPYCGMGQERIRGVVDNIVQKMTERGMKVAGFVSNGEHNTLRSMGYTRPVSVLRIKASVRAKYSKLGENRLLKMINPIENEHSVLVAEDPKSVVPSEVLKEISDLRTSGVSVDDIISRLRCRTVPSGYPIHRWKDGVIITGREQDEEKENRCDQLRSILAQYEYRQQVRSWESRGVPFCTHMYVPEVHHISKSVFHEREDEGHVFKRIGQATRRGGPDKLKLERFTEALYDEHAMLTFPALTGQRKQSIRDVEILFSKNVEKFMETKGYTFEAMYIRTVRNWRLACDKRGLRQLERCRYNYEFLSMMLDELMPWHKTEYDFSLLEVTRSVKGVLGFTREIVIALSTDIESREWRRRELEREPEHPRASTTDDVECMFSIMRDLSGSHFTLRTAKYNWRKVCGELSKRLDPDLPFFYHTSSHDRFYEGDRPSFDMPGKSRRNPREQRIRRREQLSQLVYGRATLPIPGARSTRMTFHNKPVELPPPTSTVNPLTDHNYSR